MAITKKTFLAAMKKSKACADKIYMRKSTTKERSIIISNEEPTDKTMVWFRPDIKVNEFSRNKIVVSTTEPTEKDKIWIQEVTP